MRQYSPLSVRPLTLFFCLILCATLAAHEFTQAGAGSAAPRRATAATPDDDALTLFPRGLAPGAAGAPSFLRWAAPFAPVQSSGLVGHWRFDEGLGGTAADNSVTGAPGALQNGASWGAGAGGGGAAGLDGVDDYVQVGSHPALAVTSGLSVSAWLYPTGAGSLATLGGIVVNREGEYEIARFQDGTIQWALANQSPGWNWVNTGYVAPLNQWTHIAVTYENGLAKTYANGQLVHTHQGAGAIGDIDATQNDFRIGGRQGIPQHFQGRLDEVRVYNRALTAAEAAALYTPIRPYTGTPLPVPGTVQAEDFDNGGEGVAYHDLTAANDGGLYRTTGVDVCNCGSPYGNSVGWTQPGEWLE
jgi:hypothetical protein